MRIVIEGRRTDYAGDAVVPWDSFSVVAFSPLERLGEVDGGLLLLALEVELVYAALGDH